MNNRLNLVFDWYRRDTKGMLAPGAELPAVLGASAPLQNTADLRSKGWEITVDWNDQIGKVKYNLGFNLYDAQTKITKYNNETGLFGKDKNDKDTYRVGMELGEIWGYVTDRLYTVDDFDADGKLKAGIPKVEGYNPNPGDILYKDLDDNDIINGGTSTTKDPGDRKIIGNEEPRYIYSFTLSADWNNIWVSAFFQGVGKQDWYPSNEASTFWGQYNRPYNQMPSWHVGNYWTPENPDALLPRYAGYYAPFYGGHKNANTRYLMNAAYLRLKNIQVGYNLPSEWIKKLHLTNVGIYLSGENLFTWSPLYKYSKDVNVSNIGESDKDLTSSNSGDGYNYPMMKSFSIGLNVTF